MGELVAEDQLKEWSGNRQRGWLMEVKIPYHLAAGGRIVTTQTAIDASLLGTPQAEEPIEFADDDMRSIEPWSVRRLRPAEEKRKHTEQSKARAK